MTRAPLTTYSKLCTEFYDLEQHINGPEALAFYMNQAKQAQGPILEPMCGSGRFMIPMLQAGLDVEGFDASEYMIDAFKQKYDQAPVWQEFVQDFKRDKLYTLIFIPYGSWGLITNREDVKKGLCALHKHLAPGGKFLVEIETVASVPTTCGTWHYGAHTKPDGSKIALHFLLSYQPETQLFQSLSRYELLVNGIVKATEEEIFQQYLYQIDELDELLKEAGFDNITKYPAFDATKTVKTNTKTIIYECLKT